MHQVFFLILSFFYCSICWSGGWQITEGELKFSKQAIEFSNRAQCAKQSLLPTRKVYVLLDNVNVGKSLYRLAKQHNKEPKEFINYGLHIFRSGLSRLSQIIATGLLKGNLAYINDDSQSNELLQLNWSKYKNKNSNGISCSSIKKISTLQRSLSTSRPDIILLKELIKEQNDLESYISSCESVSQEVNPEIGLLLFEVPDDMDFQKNGFKFWHSFKIYLSWAFRNAPEITGLMYPFDFLFKSLHLEEMVLIFSATCESVNSPECSSHELSLEKIRQFTFPSNSLIDDNYLDLKMEDFASSHFSSPLPLKEDDLLNLLKTEKSEEWIRNFRDGLISTRGYLKIKLKGAISKLRLISKALDSESIIRKINLEANSNHSEAIQELFYLCSEFRVAFSKEYSLINKTLSQLKKFERYASLLEELQAPSIESLKDLTEKLPEKILKSCNDFENKRIWTGDVDINRDGFAYWYKRLVNKEQTPNNLNPVLWRRVVEKPFLVMNREFSLCSTGAHCAREVLDSYIVLANSVEIFDAYIPQNQINTTNMANPFASRMACGLYDPWQKQHQVMGNFLGDLFTAGVMSVTPVPIFVSASIDPKQVGSFDSLIKDGKIFYSPNYDKRRIHLSLLADLGPLMGVPCAISVAGSKINPFEYYMFKGISLNQCWERTKNELTLESGEEFDKKDDLKKGCVGCAINLETIASSASIINPLFRGSFFLLKGIVKLASELKRPQDIPREWRVFPQKAALSYRYHGEITKKCARKLIKGKSCLPICGAGLIENFTEKFKGTPIYSDFNCFLNKGRIYIKECSDPIDLAKRGGLQLVTNCNLKER